MRHGKSLCLFSLLFAMSATIVWAAIRDDLVGKTLSCSGGSQIHFDATGANASVVSSGGALQVAVAWKGDDAELRAPGAQTALHVKKTGEAYAFEGVICQLRP